MFKNMKIASKILSVILMTSLSALIFVYVLSYTEILNLAHYSQDANIKLGITASTESEDALLNQAEEYLSKLVVEQADNLNALFTQVESEILASRDYLQVLYAKPKNFVGQIPPAPNQTQEGTLCAKFQWAPTVPMDDKPMEELKLVSSVGHMFHAITSNNINLDNLYLGTETGISYRYSRSSVILENYDPRQRAWYLAAKKLKHDDGVVWMDTYVSSDGIIVITCCAPFFSPNGDLVGVVSTDITLSNLNSHILDIKIGNNGYAFLLDDIGYYIAHPEYESADFNRDAHSMATGEWKNILSQIASGKSGLGRAVINDTDAYVAYAPIKNVGWSLGVTVPIKEIIAPAVATKAKIDTYTDTTETYIYKRHDDILGRFIILFILCAILLIILSFLLSSLMIERLEKLLLGAQAIGRGNFDYQLDVTGTDEISSLALEFNDMAKKVKGYVEAQASRDMEKRRGA